MDANTNKNATVTANAASTDLAKNSITVGTGLPSTISTSIDKAFADSVLDMSVANGFGASVSGTSIIGATPTPGTTKEQENSSTSVSMSNSPATVQNGATVPQETNSADTRAIHNMYVAGNSRLVNFGFIDGSTDQQHRCWFKLESVAADGLGLVNLKNSLNSNYKSLLDPIFDSLTTTGYMSVIITALSEGFQEKASDLPTVGDSYALSFAGKTPSTIAINGFLPFDYSGADSNWFTVFSNAYKYIFRGSILAKYKCRLSLICPDFSRYLIYPNSFQTTIVAESDNLVQFTMGAYVTNIPPLSSRLYDRCTTQIGTNTPSNVGISSSNSTFAANVANAVNNLSNNSGVKALTALAKQGTGAVDFENLTAYGSRTTPVKQDAASIGRQL